MSKQQPEQGEQVDVQAVLQVLSQRIATLSVENAVLQARLTRLEKSKKENVESA